MRTSRNLLFLLFAFLQTGYSQDTLKVFQYNLLFYGSGSTPINTKNGYLRTIIGHENPAMFGANEIGNRSWYSDTLLSQVLWQLYGYDSWDKAAYTNVSGGNLTNMLFWDKQYFGLSSQKVVVVPGTAGVDRDMNIYNMYYYKPGYDTIFFTVAVVHLKASISSSNQNRRRNMVKALMDTLSAMNPQYLIVMGDMNYYFQDEPGLDTMLNYSDPNVRLYDPANKIGDWHLNAAFADVHTQSTRLANIGDGGATGGMDDRFDFIFCNAALFNASATMRYLPNSYNVVGQDGQHFDVGLLDPPANTTVPSAVLNALYYHSDHLPVTSRFIFNPPPKVPMASAWNLTFYENNQELNFTWIPQSEENVTQILFQQAEDPDKFKTLAVLDKQNKAFSLPKDQLLRGHNFFRLEILYASGETEYSNIVNYTFVPALTLGNPYPNPASNFAYIPVQTLQELEAEWKIYNVFGQIVSQGKTRFARGNNLFQVNVSGLPDGIYLFKTNHQLRKFLVKH